MFGSDDCLACYGFNAPSDRCTSNCMCRDGAGLQYPEDLPNGGGYRQCCTSRHWVGEALAMRILNQTTGAMSLWNHPEFFDYIDSWTSSPEDWSNSTTPYYRDIYGYGGDGGGFMTYMWNTYR